MRSSASAPNADRSEEWRLCEELSIAGWRTSLHQEAFAACDNLALGVAVPDTIVDYARGHLLYYADPITGVTFREIDAAIDASNDVSLPIQSRVNASNWLSSVDPIRSPWRPGSTIALVREEVLLKRSVERWQPVDLHRFAEYDDGLELARVSRPFTFLHWGTERAGSLSVDDNALIVAFGVDDARAYACRVPIARLDELLDAGVLGLLHSHR